jgi:F-type H+-transporting ATPase subunit b
VILPDYTLFIQIANFLILMFLLNRVLYRPVRRILGKRKEEMNAFQSLIEDFQKRAAGHAKKIEQDTAEARKEGLKDKEALKSQGLDEEKQMLRKASSTAADKLSQARKELDGKVKGVRQSLEKEMALFSKELAEKVLGRSL